MIDICMLACNRARITRIAITELKRRTTTPHRLIVLDNGSDDDTVNVLYELDQQGLIDQVILSDENYGVHWGHNELLEMVESELYVSTDNDLVPCAPTDDGDWLARLLALMDDYPDHAAIACRPHILIGEGRDLFDGAPPVKQRGHVGAHLRLMRTDAVLDTGGWRKVKTPKRNNEERWICGRLRKAGWQVGYARNVKAIHLFGIEELGEDPWGYSIDSDHKARGHRDIWPPVNRFSWDRMGIDWQTCE